MPKRPLTLLALLAAFALGLGACGEKQEPDLAEIPPPPAAGEQPAPDEPPNGNGGGQGGQAGGGSPSRDERLATDAEQTVETYIGWIDRGRGRRLCALIDERALKRLRLPVRRGGCARSLTASIGYRSRRGRPVFDGATVREISARVNGRRARVLVTVGIRFADRDQASVEDDVVYLVRRRGNWIVAKPSATLYRAIGAEVPPSALAPPR